MKQHRKKIFILLLILSIIATIWSNKLEKAQLRLEAEKTAEKAKLSLTEDNRGQYNDPKYIAQLVNEYADYYGVSRRAMHLIVANESGYNFKAYNPKDGRSGCQAWGLVQFNTCYMGKGMKVEDMKNPHFALDVLARKIAHGNGTAWTTYRTCINKEVIIHNGKQIKCDTSKVITV